MLYFMCFFALCGLLAPSQASDYSDNPMAMVNVCCRDVEKILTGALDGKLDTLLMSKNKQGGGVVGSLLGTATNLLKLKQSKLLQVQAFCTENAIRVKIVLCIDVSCSPKLLKNVLETGGLKYVTVQVTVAASIPLRFDPINGLHLVFSKETCDALRISVQATSVDKIGALLPLTKAMKTSLANVIAPKLCKGLSRAVAVLNAALSKVGCPMPPNGDDAPSMDYSIKKISNGGDGCLAIGLEASDKNGPFAGPGVPKLMPKMTRNGVSVSTDLIKHCFKNQIPEDVINGLLKQSNCLMECGGLKCMNAEGEEMQNLVCKVKITGTPQISIDNGNTCVIVTLAVTVYDPVSEEMVCTIYTTIKLITTMSHEGGCLTFTWVSYSIETTVPDSSCKCLVDNAELQVAIKNCAEEVAKAFMAHSVKIELPQCLKNSEEKEINVMDDCVAVESKEDTWESMDGDKAATCGQPEPEEHEAPEGEDDDDDDDDDDEMFSF